MEKINLTDFKKRKLKKFYVSMYIVTKEITIRTDTCIANKTLYVLWGIDIMGERQIIGIYFYNVKDNRFWLETFEDIQARGVENTIFLVSPQDKNIERCAKLVYNDIKIIEAPNNISSNISKYWADRPTRKMQVQLKELFLLENKERYDRELEIFKNIYVDDKLTLMILNKQQNKIDTFYEYKQELRELFYPYYTIKEMKKYLNKIKTKEPLCTDINEVIEFCLPLINSFEIGRNYSKKKWLELVGKLYEEYEEKMKEYI